MAVAKPLAIDNAVHREKNKPSRAKNSNLATRLTASETFRSESPLQRQPPPPFKNGQHVCRRIVSTATAATVAVAWHPACLPSPHARPKVAPWGFHEHADTQTEPQPQTRTPPSSTLGTLQAPPKADTSHNQSRCKYHSPQAGRYSLDPNSPPPLPPPRYTSLNACAHQAAVSTQNRGRSSPESSLSIPVSPGEALGASREEGTPR